MLEAELPQAALGFSGARAFDFGHFLVDAGGGFPLLLLLEEPGIHLHYSGQRDLLEVR